MCWNIVGNGILHEKSQYDHCNTEYLSGKNVIWIFDKMKFLIKVHFTKNVKFHMKIKHNLMFLEMENAEFWK